MLYMLCMQMHMNVDMHIHVQVHVNMHWLLIAAEQRGKLEDLHKWVKCTFCETSDYTVHKLNWQLLWIQLVNFYAPRGKDNSCNTVIA